MQFDHNRVSEFLFEVRKRTVLYEENSNEEERKQAWDQIAEIFNLTVEEAESQFKCLVHLHRLMFLNLPDDAFRFPKKEVDSRWAIADREIAVSLSHFIQKDLDFLFIEHAV